MKLKGLGILVVVAALTGGGFFGLSKVAKHYLLPPGAGVVQVAKAPEKALGPVVVAPPAVKPGAAVVPAVKPPAAAAPVVVKKHCGPKCRARAAKAKTENVRR